MAEADCVTRLTAKQLLEAAKFSQTRARGRRAGFRDSILLTSCGTSPVSLEFPNEVQPLSALDELRRTHKPVSFIQPIPWSGQKDLIAIPVRFMFGHSDLTVHFRVPIARGTHCAGAGELVGYLTIEPLEFQPGLQAVIDAAGPLAGVGIREDLEKFNKLLEILTGQRLSFKPPIDVAVVARLAGFNLPRHGVANLIWSILGSVVPKGVVSVGDGKWHLPLQEIPDALRVYLRCDTVLVSYCLYVLVVCWVIHVMPDFDVVMRLSIARHPRSLLQWWVGQMVDNVASSLGGAGSWEPANTRPEGMRLPSMGSKHQFLLCHLTPDWPAVTAGGCRYFHTARSLLLDRLPTLAALDSEFWLVNYTEIDLFITLGRDVPSRPSSRDPTSSPRLTYNPECTGGALTLPADQINKERFTSLVAPYRPKRVILIEYVLAHPDQAALLLLKLESNRTFAHQLFCTDRKIRKLMAELRSTLSAVGALPRRPDDWVDPIPSGKPGAPG
jgi:hypothetical protein